MSVPLTKKWIEDYQKSYVKPVYPKHNHYSQEIKPNIMQQNALSSLSTLRKENKDKALLISATGFRVIIVTVANSLGNIRVFELLPKLKTKKYGWCIA